MPEIESHHHAHPPLRLSDNRRYLVDREGRPFFYFADTAWSIVWKGREREWIHYLERRHEQGLTVVQVNLLPWCDDLADVEGNAPFVAGDVTRPNEAYFARYDRFLNLASKRGLFTCLMLLWGGPREGLPAARFTTEQATHFARWAVERFTGCRMIWSVSGDGPYDEEAEKWEAVGQAVDAADPNDHPTTNHLVTSRGWRFLHHRSAWHDFHMIQTGHYAPARDNIRALPLAYYRAKPTKAFVNGEPWYEAHPDMSDRPAYGPIFDEEHQRYAFWVSLLSGATMGHTYGAQGIWNWKRPGDDEAHLAGPQIGPIWSEALELLGAEQCALGVRCLREWSWWRLQPTPERARSVSPETPPARQPACARIPGEGWLVYLPADDHDVELLGLNVPGVGGLGVAGHGWRARWLDPRDGAEHAIGAVDVPGDGIWRAPERPSDEDWVLLLSAE